MSQQVSTRAVNLSTVMARRAFQRGHAEGVAGKPFNYEAFTDNTNRQWEYERGRLLALSYKGPLKEGRKVLPQAIKAYVAAMKYGNII